MSHEFDSYRIDESEKQYEKQDDRKISRFPGTSIDLTEE
jgi:hypothetical protein